MDLHRPNSGQVFTGLLWIIAGFWLFGLLINQKPPLSWIGFLGLGFSAWMIAKEMHHPNDFILTFNLNTPNNPVKNISLGIIVGLGLAILYNSSIHSSLIPEQLQWFTLVAAAIGMTEELIFRGFVQRKASQISPLWGVVVASLAHSIYKCCLFVFPDPSYHFPLIFLFLLTFAVGLLAGWITEYSKSVIPALAGHAVFDIVVYGGLSEAPWWSF